MLLRAYARHFPRKNDIYGKRLFSFPFAYGNLTGAMHYARSLRNKPAQKFFIGKLTDGPHDGNPLKRRVIIAPHGRNYPFALVCKQSDHIVSDVSGCTRYHICYRHFCSPGGRLRRPFIKSPGAMRPGRCPAPFKFLQNRQTACFSACLLNGSVKIIAIRP